MMVVSRTVAKQYHRRMAHRHIHIYMSLEVLYHLLDIAYSTTTNASKLKPPTNNISWKKKMLRISKKAIKCIMLFNKNENVNI